MYNMYFVKGMHARTGSQTDLSSYLWVSIELWTALLA